MCSKTNQTRNVSHTHTWFNHTHLIRLSFHIHILLYLNRPTISIYTRITFCWRRDAFCKIILLSKFRIRNEACHILATSVPRLLRVWWHGLCSSHSFHLKKKRIHFHELLTCVSFFKEINVRGWGRSLRCGIRFCDKDHADKINIFLSFCVCVTKADKESDQLITFILGQKHTDTYTHIYAWQITSVGAVRLVVHPQTRNAIRQWLSVWFRQFVNPKFNINRMCENTINKNN